MEDLRPIIKNVPDDQLADLAHEFRRLAERAMTREIKYDLVALAERLDEMAAEKTGDLRAQEQGTISRQQPRRRS
jgi:hypothetical protein